MKKPLKQLEYYYQACPKHPDRVWVKAHGIEGALCEVHAFNGQSALDSAMGLVFMLTTVGKAIQESIEERRGSCDEAQRE